MGDRGGQGRAEVAAAAAGEEAAQGQPVFAEFEDPNGDDVQPVDVVAQAPCLEAARRVGSAGVELDAAQPLEQVRVRVHARRIALCVADRQVRVERPVVAETAVQLEGNALVLAVSTRPVANHPFNARAVGGELFVAEVDVVRLVRDGAGAEHPVPAELPVEAKGDLVLVEVVDALDLAAARRPDLPPEQVVALCARVPVVLGVGLLAGRQFAVLAVGEVERDVLVVAPDARPEQQ